MDIVEKLLISISGWEEAEKGGAQRESAARNPHAARSRNDTQRDRWNQRAMEWVSVTSQFLDTCLSFL